MVVMYDGRWMTNGSQRTDVRTNGVVSYMNKKHPFSSLKIRPKSGAKDAEECGKLLDATNCTTLPTNRLSAIYLVTSQPTNLVSPSMAISYPPFFSSRKTGQYFAAYFMLVYF